MDAPRRILFVCTGNICRSAMAERLLRHWSDTRGLGLEVRSCGTGAQSWFEVPSVVRRLLAECGAPPFEHTPRLATRDQLRWADLVLAMTSAHREHLSEQFPEFGRKIRLLREQAGLGEEDVADPMGQSDQVFQDCLAAIQQSLEALVRTGFRAPGENLG